MPESARFTARLVRVAEDEVWTDEALAGLVGQRPASLTDEGVDTLIVRRAWIEDGWLMADLERADHAAEPTPCPCGDGDCWQLAADYPWCGKCQDHHRVPVGDGCFLEGNS